MPAKHSKPRTSAAKEPGSIAIYYEHPHWFRPLFAELERRGAEHVRIDATHHSYKLEKKAIEPQANGNGQRTHRDKPWPLGAKAKPANGNGHSNGYGLFFNRMSPSAWQRGHGHNIFYTLNYLAHLESQGTRVVNGHKAFTYETSKARQLELLAELGLPAPRSRVVNHPAQALEATIGLRWPIVVKPNIGGSGAGVQRFDRAEDLAAAIDDGKITLGIDSIGIVQEFIPARDNHITRVEVLGAKYLYAIKVHLTGETFDLCPADICQDTRGRELERAACPVDAPKSGLKVESTRPPTKVIKDVERLTQAAGIEVGGVEYIIDDRDGALYYYDINALSNFVADAKNVIGFDPFVKLADYLQKEAR